MKNLIHTLILVAGLLFCANAYAQDAPDFTITDSDGIERSLYADYLDEGKTVVLKFFFVNCPPCNFIAPSIQELYVEWGEGNEDVEFIELSIFSSDTDDAVNEYKGRHGITFPGAGGEGGSTAAASPYTSGDFGTFRGTPSFAVIAPDRSQVYGVGGAGNAGRIANLDAAIAATGATGGAEVLPAVFNINVTDAFGEPDDGVEISITDANDPSVSYPVSSTSLSILSIEDDFPGITDPVLTFSKTGTASEQVNPLDMLLMRKHILSIIPITDPDMLIAGDTNGDGTISPLDMLNMRKLILAIITEFPVPTYRFVPETLPIDVINGQTQDLEIKAIKIGDLNGF